MQENEHKKEQSSRKQNEMQHKKSFVTRYVRGEMLQKVAQKKSAPEHGEISESARKCEQKREFIYTICAGASRYSGHPKKTGIYVKYQSIGGVVHKKC